MRRHILSRPTWRPYRDRAQLLLCPSRYASIRTFGEPTPRWLAVHYEIRLFGATQRRCDLPIGLSSREDGPSPYGAVTSLRSEALSGKQCRIHHALGSPSLLVWEDLHPLPFSFPAPPHLSGPR